MELINTQQGRLAHVLYLDIDGTVRKGLDEIGRFVNTRDDVEVFEGVPELLWGYKNLGWRIVGVSNQGGIALGHMSLQDAMGAMGETQMQCRMAFDKIVMCTHHPDAESPAKSVCWCRKPKIGLIVDSALRLSDRHEEIYPPYMSVMVGDRPEDEACAKGAGLEFIPAAEWRSGQHLGLLQAMRGRIT